MNTTQFGVLFVREDGEEFGIIDFGKKVKKFQSVFPSDLFHFGKLHDSIVEAIEYIGNVWEEVQINKVSFITAMEHQNWMAMECGGSC